MEKRTINIVTPKGAVEVTGDLVMFENYEDFEFVAYKSPDVSKVWLVSEVTTGLMLPQQFQCTNKPDAVVQAEIMLKTLTQEKLRDLIRKSIIKIAYTNPNQEQWQS